ncbi:MAG: hypothetical protein JW909_09405 [Planctomycetes bacterium]|nr:hypothetical protein [Planctomycetota bacterium]
MTQDTNRPGYEDVMESVEEVRSHPLCDIRMLGKSVQGRDIPLVTLTDPAVPDDDKQHALILAGMHGTEESGRSIALELISFLASGREEAAETLRRQVVAVVPCSNPDGAVLATYRNAEDVDIAHTFTFDTAAGTPEGRAIEQFAVPFAPEIVVDIHGLAGGSMMDRVWFEQPWRFTPDRFFLSVIGNAMSGAAEAAGFPQREVSPPLTWKEEEIEGLRLGGKLAAECKSLGLGLEAIEHYYREPEWRAAGLVRLRRLLRFGNEDEFGLGEPGYPTSLVSGSRICGLKAHGIDASSRRRNRVELTRFLATNWAIVDRGADGLDKCARVLVESKGANGPNPRRFAVLLRVRKPCEIQTIQWENEALEENDEHGYRIWEDANSRLIQVNLQAPLGGPGRLVTVRYDCPFFHS